MRSSHALLGSCLLAVLLLAGCPDDKPDANADAGPSAEAGSGGGAGSGGEAGSDAQPEACAIAAPKWACKRAVGCSEYFVADPAQADCESQGGEFLTACPRDAADYQGYCVDPVTEPLIRVDYYYSDASQKAAWMQACASASYTWCE